MKIIAGNSNIQLAKDVSKILNIPLTETVIKKFSDKEIFVEIMENVRGEDVFVIQSTSYPANDNMMELLITIDALKRGSARRITAVIPYYGYARQDRKTGPRTPISARLIADLLTVAGANRVLTMDLHAGQIQGFFNIPLDNLIAAPVFQKDILKRFEGKLKDVLVISPDVGGVVRARDIAKRIGTDLAIIDKRREKPGVSEVMNIIGNVEGKHCIIVDDIADTAGTLCNAAEALLAAGALSCWAYISHGVLSGPAIERVTNSRLSKLIITDSIEASESIQNCDKIEQVSVKELIAEAMKRINEEKSVSSLFK